LADWRRPLVVLDVEPANEVTLEEVNGKLALRRGVKVTFDRESTERIRTGYACARCLEVFEVPWPLSCPVCRAPIRERQAEYFEREYTPAVLDLSPTDWSDELASLEERRRKEEESNGRHPA